MKIFANKTPQEQALVWVVVSAFLFTFSSIFVKLLSSHLPNMEIVFARALVTFLMMAAIAGVDPQLRLGLWRGRNLKGAKFLILRGVFGTIGLCGYFYGIAHLPLALVAILHRVSPIFVITFSMLFLGERYERSFFAWSALAFFGLFLTVADQWILGLALGRSAVAESWQDVDLGVIGIVLIGTLCSGAAYTITRAATSLFDNRTIVLWFMGVSILLIGPFVVFDHVAPIGMDWVWIPIMGISAGGAQLAMTQGFRLAPAGLTSSFGNSGIVFAVFFDILIWNQWLTWIQVAGVVIVLFAIKNLTKTKISMRVKDQNAVSSG